MKDGERILLTIIGISAILVPILLWVVSSMISVKSP